MASSVIMKTFKQGLFQGDFDMDNGVFYVALTSGTLNVSTTTLEDMRNFSAVQNAGYETTGYNGVYTSGGSQLNTSAITLNGSNAIWDASNVTWSSSKITSDGCVIYLSGNDHPNNSRLVCFITFSSEKTSNNGDFTIQWNSAGILNLTS